MIEIVFKQRDNINTVTFTDDSGVLDFAATTRMVLKFEGSTESVDTDIDPTFIDFSTGSGVVIFKLGTLTIADDTVLPASLINYDPAHLNGQIIVHAQSGALQFRFFDPI